MDELHYDGRSSQSASELFSFIQIHKSRNMKSNATFSASALEALREENSGWISIGSGAAIILCPDTENIVRLFYYARDKTTLPEVLELIPPLPESIVCDIVGREPAAATQAKELQDLGVSLYAKFQRMTCANFPVDSTLDFARVEPALQEDAQEIYEMLHQEFDPLTARMPSMQVLRERIQNLEVFLIRGGKEIAGFCIFSSRNKRGAIWEYAVVRPQFRRMGIANTILYYKWAHQNESQTYSLWVDTKCAGPIRFHESNGFREDGVYDYILLPAKGKPCGEEGDTGCC